MKFLWFFTMISSSFLGLQALDGEDAVACSLQPRFAIPLNGMGGYDFSISNNTLVTLGTVSSIVQNVTAYDIDGDEQVVPNYIETAWGREYHAIRIAGNGTIVAIHAMPQIFKGDPFVRIFERTKSGNSGNSSHWRQRGEDLRPVGGFCYYDLTKDGSVLNFYRCRGRGDNTWSSVAYRYNGTDWDLRDDSCREEHAEDAIRILKTEPYMDGNGLNQVGRNGRIRVLLWNGCSFSDDGVVVGSARDNVLGAGGASLSKDGNVLAASEYLHHPLLPGEKYPENTEHVVQIFVRSSNGTYTRHTTIKKSRVYGVALSNDGKLLAVGDCTGPGSVTLFQWFPDHQTWQEVGSPVVGVSEDEALCGHLKFNEEGSVLVAGTTKNHNPEDKLLRVIDVVCDPSLPNAYLPRSIGGPQSANPNLRNPDKPRSIDGPLPANPNIRNPVGAAAYVFLLLFLGVAALVLYSHRYCCSQSETVHSYETVQVIHDKPPADEISNMETLD